MLDAVLALLHREKRSEGHPLQSEDVPAVSLACAMVDCQTPREIGRGPKLGLCLAWVRKTQKAASFKAAAKDARFGAYFTQIVRFPA